MATVVLLLTDIEGSTRRWADNAAAMRSALERHDVIVRGAIEDAGGTVFKHTGDGMLAVMPSAAMAASAASAAQATLRSTDWTPFPDLPVRMAIHAGDAEARGDDWFGPALNRGARLLGIGHGGQILVSSAARALLVDGLPVGAALSDLGEHRLRDLTSPEHEWQLDVGPPRAFPMLRSLAESSTNLPVQLTLFLGREREVRDLAATVVANRLTTLVGLGGMGKTRLAIEAASAISGEFAGGVRFVELAPLSSAEAIDRVTLDALGVAVTSDLPPRELIVRALSDRVALLVVDNCEHLLDGVRNLLDDLLRRCPKIHVLATSREPVRVRGERTWQIPPMDAEGEGVALFVERATAVRQDFAAVGSEVGVVADICRRLDGMPLAIELAASKVEHPRARYLTDVSEEEVVVARPGTLSVVDLDEPGIVEFGIALDATLPIKLHGSLCELSLGGRHREHPFRGPDLRHRANYRSQNDVVTIHWTKERCRRRYATFA